jgi:hypothetical protein
MSTDPMPIPAPDAQPVAKVSPFGRIIGMLFSPKATFEDIARKPSCLLPLILLVIAGTIVGVGLTQKVNWREFMSQQIEKNPAAAQLSNEQKEQRIEAGAKIAPISSCIIGISTLIVVLLVALIMWGAYNLLAGAALNYKTSLAIVSHAYVPAVISFIVFLIVVLLKPYGTLDLENPVATNLAAFLPEDSAKWLVALGKNLDMFILWITLLIAIGFAAANPKKLKGSKSYTIAFGMLAVWIILRMGIAFAFS